MDAAAAVARAAPPGRGRVLLLLLLCSCGRRMTRFWGWGWTDGRRGVRAGRLGGGLRRGSALKAAWMRASIDRKQRPTGGVKVRLHPLALLLPTATPAAAGSRARIV